MKIKFGASIVVLITLIAVLAPWIADKDPNAMSLADRLSPPSSQHWLGLDENGSDVFSKLIWGSRISLLVAWCVVLVSALTGLVIGSWSAYQGGWADQILMRITDMFYAFPGFLLALALVAVMGPSIQNLIFALCLTSWTGFARLVRGEVLHLKNREYVQSARAMGASSVRIVVLHIWPNVFALLITQATFVMAGTIISEAGLSFLGLGVPAQTPTWGALLSSGRRVLVEAPHVSLAPGLAIILLVWGFNLLGDGLRDQLDPRRAKVRV